MNINSIDKIDRKIIEATQSGLPITSRPYHQVAELTGLEPETVLQRIINMKKAGIIRRIGAVPNHYRLGYQANGMTVWDVPDEHVQELGRRIGKLEFVSHCYHRPRHLPDWPFNLFAMVHGRDFDTTENYIRQISELLGESNNGHTVLYSTRILKKTGMRI